MKQFAMNHLLVVIEQSNLQGSYVVLLYTSSKFLNKFKFFIFWAYDINTVFKMIKLFIWQFVPNPHFTTSLQWGTV